MNTNWSTPKTNIVAGINDLRKALASGQNARLIRLRNEDCAYPIKEKKEDENFRNYEFRINYLSTVDEIRNSTSMSDIEKTLTLNFKICYGTPKAVAHYYATGKVSADNFFNDMGVAHLVRVKDMIEYLETNGDSERAEMFRAQYFGDEQNNRHFWDFYQYKYGSPWLAKHFKRKLWVVELLDKDEPRPIPWLIHIMNALMYPLKYIPIRSILKMPEYTSYTFRIGDTVHGFSVEFQIPKKFSFN